MRKGIRINWIVIVMMILFCGVILGLSNIVMLNQYNIMQIVSKNVLISILIVLLFAYIFIYHKDILNNNKVVLYGTIVMTVLIPSILIANTVYFFLMPFLIAVMIVSIMIDQRLALITNLFMVLLISLISFITIEYVWFFIISGSVAAHLIANAKERQKILYVALYMLIVNGIVILLVSLSESAVAFNFDILVLVYVVVNAVLSVIIAMGSMPLWETIFNVITPYKLLELTNSNQKLLQKLMIEAPGTYHHSQMVANLAETAAADIGGNALLARTGALYHDIGKTEDPKYFTENQNGYNPHDELAPESSASIIISHVADGVKIAKENNLPKSIIDIIEQHQGDTIVRYFYHKAKEHSDGFEIDESLFKYAGPKPQTNEAAIVMLADCVEAYVRALNESDRTIEVIDNVIQEIISSKMSENQLDECDLKISELSVIAKAFRKVYNGMYHERVKYPKKVS